MARHVSIADAKARLSALVARVADNGERFVLERRGKPLAALVSIEVLERVERGQAMSARPQGALAILGAWRELEDIELDPIIADIYAERRRDTGQALEFED